MDGDPMIIAGDWRIRSRGDVVRPCIVKDEESGGVYASGEELSSLNVVERTRAGERTLPVIYLSRAALHGCKSQRTIVFGENEGMKTFFRSNG
jgi:hypothetical protein